MNYPGNTGGVALRVTAFSVRSVDPAATADIQKGEAVCQRQDRRERYQQAGDHDEHRLHAAPIPELSVDLVNALRAEPYTQGTHQRRSTGVRIC